MPSYAQIQTFIERYCPFMAFIFTAIICVWLTPYGNKFNFMVGYSSSSIVLYISACWIRDEFIHMENKLNDVLKKKSFYNDVINPYINISLNLPVLAASISVIGYFSTSEYATYYFAIASGLFYAAAASIARVYYVFYKILACNHAVQTKQKSREND